MTTGFRPEEVAPAPGAAQASEPENAVVPALQLTGVSKAFTRGDERLVVLDQVDLRVDCGEFVAIEGRSGSGKSTLLYLAGGFTAPDAGDVEIGGRRLGECRPRDLAKLRRTEIGFVFQFFHLIPTLSVSDNIALPLIVNRAKNVDARVSAMMERVGLGSRSGHRPTELSGGEMQRTAIARALVIEPSVVIADEPTGNLDSRSADQVLDLLTEAVRDAGAGLLLVTHSPDVSARGPRRYDARRSTALT